MAEVLMRFMSVIGTVMLILAALNADNDMKFLFLGLACVAGVTWTIALAIHLGA